MLADGFSVNASVPTFASSASAPSPFFNFDEPIESLQRPEHRSAPHDTSSPGHAIDSVQPLDTSVLISTPTPQSQLLSMQQAGSIVPDPPVVPVGPSPQNNPQNNLHMQDLEMGLLAGMKLVHDPPQRLSVEKQFVSLPTEPQNVQQGLPVSVASKFSVAPLEPVPVFQAAFPPNIFNPESRSNALSNPAFGSPGDCADQADQTQLVAGGCASIDHARADHKQMEAERDGKRSRSPVPRGECIYVALERKKASLLEQAERIKSEKRSAELAFRARVGQEASRLAETNADAQRELVFRQYDGDRDGLLNGHEIAAFVRGEYPGLDIPIDMFKGLLRANAARGLPGVPRSQFPQLKSLIDDEIRKRKEAERSRRAEAQSKQIGERVGEVSAAMEGIAAEITKAEEVVKALAAMVPEKMEQAIDDAASAVGSAKDFLSAATETLVCQSHGDIEPEAVWLVGAEVRKLGLVPLETRLQAAAATVDDCRRLVLHRKKTMLLRDLKPEHSFS